MNFLETAEDDEIFSYFDVQNLSIDHSLTLPEITQYKDLIFSPNSLQQIYFKGSTDIETVELIKNLLSISEYANDAKIDKYILIDLKQPEIDKLLNDTYEFPDTWKLPYEFVDDSFSLTDIPRFRTLRSFIHKLMDKPLSQLEQLMKIYDEIKLMDYDSSEENIQLPEIIHSKRANSYGMNKLFSYILNQIGFKTFLGEIMSNGVKSSITLVEVKDSKYNLDGIYVFDPSMDTLSKENYKKDDVRRISYNFFGIPLKMLERTISNDKLSGIISILAIDDLDYSVEKIENCKSFDLLKEKEKILNTFGYDYESMHDRLKKTKMIDIDVIVSASDVLYQEKYEKYNDILKENYKLRKEELFIKDTEEELEEFIRNEK